MSREEVARQAFTPSQWRTFMAIADTIFPAQTPEQVEEILALLPQGQGNRAAIEKFLTRNASDCDEFKDALDEVFAQRIPKEAAVKVRMVLDLLDGGVITFLLTRAFTGFSRLPLPTRTIILQNWSQSWLPILRTLHRQLQLIYSNVMLKANPLLISALEYPVFPPEYTPEENDPLNPSCPHPAPPFHKPNFHVFEEPTSEGEVIELKSDIVIVGSGAGGGVCAARLAKDLGSLGVTITIVEKAGFYSPTDMPQPEIPLARIAHDNSGVIPTRDGNGLLVTGATWGGGTTINWGITLELEPPLTKSWSEKYNLGDMLLSDEFKDCKKYIHERMGVTVPEEKHLNKPNKLIWEGAKKLQLTPEPLPQNNQGRMDEHAQCGHCSSGCRSGCKQGTANSFLVDAEKAGAKCVSGVEIERVIWAPLSPGNKKICAGVEGWIVDPPSLQLPESTTNKKRRKIRIYSPRVILAAGALRTPTILHTSGIQHPSLGKNLRVHPCLFVYGLTSPENPMDPWVGSPSTVLVPITADKTQPMKAKLMRMDPPPSMSLTCVPWHQPTSYLKEILAYKHSITLLTLVRDADSSGEVGPRGTTTLSGEVGPPDVVYTFSKKDRDTAIEGIILSARILLEGGCTSVTPCIPLPPHLATFTSSQARSGDKSPSETQEFRAWEKEVRGYGCGQGWVSGHQMGTCRWGGKEGDGSVCSVMEGGRVWAAKGVYVVDAGALPEGSGVNPMGTVMAWGEWAGRRVVREVRQELEK